MRRLLIIGTGRIPSDDLAARFDPQDTVEVVAPVVGEGALGWLANDQGAFAEAEQLAQATADRLPVEPVSVRAGESDVGLAIRDALATFPADEIVVAVDSSDVPVELIARRNGGRHSFDGIPVRWIDVR